ncbi:MAG: histone deacetylase [Vicinamibacterales bacterium]
MHVIYSPRYHIDLGLHVFPTEKYALVLQRLLDSGLVRPPEVLEPSPASWDQLALVHTESYLRHMKHGTLPPDDVAALELPFSHELVEGYRLMVGGTVLAARIACGLEPGVESNGVVAHIGGGLHHAFPNHGEGFCPFNDVAVAVRVLQRDGMGRAAIVDLDVHHGNGTAAIFGSHPEVFTCSMHQENNYPDWKPHGSLDIGLPDGAGDALYLSELEGALEKVAASEPRWVVYLAGADPFEEDQLGGLRLTKDGLRRRDRLVVQMCRMLGVPLVITLAGGYAHRVEDTVAIHAATIEEAGAALLAD